MMTISPQIKDTDTKDNPFPKKKGINQTTKYT